MCVCASNSLYGQDFALDKYFYYFQNEAVFVVTNWVSEDTSEYTDELELFSCCLFTVTTVAGRRFYTV